MSLLLQKINVFFFCMYLWHEIQDHSSKLLLAYVLSLNEELEAVSLLVEAERILHWILNQLAAPVAPLISSVYFVASCLGISILTEFWM